MTKIESRNARLAGARACLAEGHHVMGPAKIGRWSHEGPWWFLTGERRCTRCDGAIFSIERLARGGRGEKIAARERVRLTLKLVDVHVPLPDG